MSTISQGTGVRTRSRVRSWLPALAIGLALALAGRAEAASLHPGDRIAVTVFAHPELSTSVTVDALGNVSLPLAGTVRAQDLDPAELQDAIRARLSRYIQVAAVDVQLTAQNESLFIAGGPSGVLPYRPGETLVSILDQLQLPVPDRPQSAANPHDSTSTTEGAPSQPVINGTQNLFDGPIDFRRVSVMRDGKTLGPYDLLALRSNGSAGIPLAPNDTVSLPNKPVAVKVGGEVTHPGFAYLYPSDPLIRAVDQVGGIQDLASQTNISLTRAGATSTVSLGGAEFASPAQPGDVVTVPRAPRVDVLGTVEKPGEQFLRGNQTLVSAIYYAGGPAQYANLKSVQVLHDGVKHEYNLAALRKGHGGDNPQLVDGDVVFVPQGSTIDAQTIFSAIGALGFLIYR